MGVISNGTTLLDAGALNASVATGKMILIKTLTASNSANLTFVHGASNVVLDGTYSTYVFKIINIHPITNGAFLLFNGRDGGTNYDATKQTNFLEATHNEDDSAGALDNNDASDLANSTAACRMSAAIGSGNDESANGEIKLFNPSQTTFVKKFISRISTYESSDIAADSLMAGYFNVTAAIDGIQFSMSSGNIDSGIIKLYGMGA